MTCPYCSILPITAERIPGLSFTFDLHTQVLVTSKSLPCSRTEHVIHALGSSFNELKSLLAVNFCRFLLDKGELGLRRWEKLFEVVDK
jgi:hypothetical protein